VVGVVIVRPGLAIWKPVQLASIMTAFSAATFRPDVPSSACRRSSPSCVVHVALALLCRTSLRDHYHRPLIFEREHMGPTSLASDPRRRPELLVIATTARVIPDLASPPLYPAAPASGALTL